MIKKILFIVLLLLLVLLKPSVIFAQEEEILEARIVEIVEEKQIEDQLYQKLKLLVENGSIKDREVIVENGNLAESNIKKYQVGDQVLLAYSKTPDGEDYFYISDYLRRNILGFLFAIFLVLTIAITGWQGITSLIGMAFSFLIIFKIIIPLILSGSDPIISAIIGTIFIIPATFYLSHGLNKKTTVAAISSLLCLIITGVLSAVFANGARLTGFASEEATFLQSMNPMFNIKGLMLSGILIGSLGILDDVTISQAAIVRKLKEANSRLDFYQLFAKAMSIGKDHIASMVNTLILVYTGAAMPLLLIFVIGAHPFLEIINYEIVAEEIIRTLSGSISLILAVPISTFLACVFEGKKTNSSS